MQITNKIEYNGMSKKGYQCAVCKKKTTHTFGKENSGWFIIWADTPLRIEFTEKNGIPMLKELGDDGGKSGFALCSKKCWQEYTEYVYQPAEVIKMDKEMK